MIIIIIRKNSDHYNILIITLFGLKYALLIPAKTLCFCFQITTESFEMKANQFGSKL